MTINTLFRNRIGLEHERILQFKDLPEILMKTAYSCPFENRTILKGRKTDLTEKGLSMKILEGHEGGVCYELNPLLYLFLKENHFDVFLIKGVVYNPATSDWSIIGKTHVAILLRHLEQLYLIDTGFGANLPLLAVPLTGETVKSRNGLFRIKKSAEDDQNYIYEMKRKDRDKHWTIGYQFSSSDILKDFDELKIIQDVIYESEHSNFNTSILITMLGPLGSFTLTEGTFTKWEKGIMTKKEIDEVQYKEFSTKYFGLSVNQNETAP